VTISALLLLAALVNHAVPRLPAPTLRLVPIDRLPRQVGGWQCLQDLPIDPKVSVIVPDAHFLSRVYRDPSGRMAQVLLETSADAQMFHSPTQCMPAQNWTVLRTRSTQVETVSPGTRGERLRASATEMYLQSAAQNMFVLYWYTSERQLDKWQALKTKLLAGRPQTRLFVRILIPDSADFEVAKRTAQDMAQTLLPAITQLEKL
jgi:EpsI family protein